MRSAISVRRAAGFCIETEYVHSGALYIQRTAILQKKTWSESILYDHVERAVKIDICL